MLIYKVSLNNSCGLLIYFGKTYCTAISLTALSLISSTSYTREFSRTILPTGLYRVSTEAIVKLTSATMSLHLDLCHFKKEVDLTT